MALGGLAGVTLLGGGLLWWQRGPAQLQPQPAAIQMPAATPQAAAPRQPAAVPPRAEDPRFDVARIGPRGGTVVAGRAAPDAEVVLHDGEREVGRARADARGDFVIQPAEPLAAGAHELSLRARDRAGQERRGEESVVLVVPAAPDRAEPSQAAPVAVLLPAPGQAAAPRVLQGPGAQPGRQLNLDIVDYDEAGAMRFAGSAAPGNTVRLYVDERHAGDTAADAAGRWTLRPQPVPDPGRHTLRVDQIGPQGKVAARLELPFQREAGGASVAEGSTVVQPGQNLWRIARATYGRGIRYTVIHQANAGQIRDPARIYPGQIFALPSP